MTDEYQILDIDVIQNSDSIAYKGGVRAWYEGKGKDDCPYQLRSQEALDWLSGFNTGYQCYNILKSKYHDEDHYFDIPNDIVIQ